MTYIPKTQGGSAATDHFSDSTLDSSTLTLSSDISHPRHRGYAHVRHHASHQQLTHLPVHRHLHPSTSMQQQSL